jgi:site-specific DNA-methyltransferase (adenine-specific)
MSARTAPLPPAGNDDERWEVRQQDCLAGIAELPADSIDAVITDPPYGINFAAQAWDRPHVKPGERSRQTTGQRYQEWCEQWANECLRVLKPGGFLASFGSPRTVHRLASGIEDAGFELRDMLMWLYGQGYPKTRNLTGEWEGWGTGLKPAYEPILLARRAPDGLIAESVARHHTGALHIDACRVADRRWPPNLLLSHHRGCTDTGCVAGCPVGDLGDHARFFYCAKPGRRERDAGCEHLPRKTIQTFKIGREDELKAEREGTLNIHPTVKPIELMRWLIRLLCAPDALVLDPFTGSGSTGAAALLEGARFIGFEQDSEYAQVARARIDHHSDNRPEKGGGESTTDGRTSITRSTNKGLEPHRGSSNGERSRTASGAHQSRRPGDASTPRARQRRDRKEVFDAH